MKGRAAAALLGAAAAGVGAWRFAVLAGHGGRAAYAMPPSVVMVAAAALAGLMLSTLVAVRAARADVILLGILTAGLLGYGVLGIFSIGLPLLLLGAAAGTALVRRLSGAPAR
jgi:methyl coenzyme M reductase beta subunit